jgi:predicted nucleotidyltransferase
MRLSKTEKSAIIEAVTKIDPDARIYLFGSRVDESKKGGDIDVLIFSQHLTFDDKINIKASISERIDEQKIDLVIAKDAKAPFVKMILEQGVELK